jgi:hypothetical protein
MTTLYQRSWPQMNETPDSLLATDEPPPFTVDNENGTSPLLIVGVGAVCCLIGKALNAVVIRQNYSRLVIDCNRTPGSGTSILDLSELTRVPGNIGLSERHKLARVIPALSRSHRDRARTATRSSAAVTRNPLKRDLLRLGVRQCAEFVGAHGYQRRYDRQL